MIGKSTGVVPSESIYNLMLGSPGRITEELKFEVTRGIYVGGDMNLRVQIAFLYIGYLIWPTN